MTSNADGPAGLMAEFAARDERQRGLLPLPLLALPSQPPSHLSRGVKQRVTRRRASIARTNDVIDAINSLYSGGDTVCKGAPSVAQSAAVVSLAERVEDGRPSSSSPSSQEASRVILGSCLTYAGEVETATQVTLWKWHCCPASQPGPSHAVGRSPGGERCTLHPRV